MKSFITGLMRHRNNYRQLDPGRIVETIEGLQSRIDERFPGAGLGRLVADLRAVADETVARTAWIQKPHLPLRVAAGTLAVVIVALFMSLVLSYHELRLTEFSNIIQVLDSGISAIVYVGAAILFLITWETRIKRARALRALHELRSLAHIVDMHQLTKDPERAFGGANDTASSPHRPLTPFELSRYLDYCAEALALIGK